MYKYMKPIDADVNYVNCTCMCPKSYNGCRLIDFSTYTWASAAG